MFVQYPLDATGNGYIGNDYQKFQHTAVQMLFARSLTNQIYHEFASVTQECKSKSVSEGKVFTHSKQSPEISDKSCMEINAHCENKRFFFFLSGIFSTKRRSFLISVIKCIQNPFYRQSKDMIVSRNDFFLVGDLVEYYSRQVFPALKWSYKYV